MNKAIFLDRDGTIIKDTGYLSSPQDVEFIDYIDIALKKLLQFEFLFIIITNQSGIGRGYYTIKDMQKVNKHIKKELAHKNIPILDFYFCPHYIGSLLEKYNIKCECRKPEPGLLKKAALDYNINLKQSYMIGDKKSDVLAGLNAGLKNSYLIDKKHDLLYYSNLICQNESATITCTIKNRK